MKEEKHPHLRGDVAAAAQYVRSPHLVDLLEEERCVPCARLLTRVCLPVVKVAMLRGGHDDVVASPGGVHTATDALRSQRRLMRRADSS